MGRYNRIVQIFLLAVAAVLLVAAGWLQGRVQTSDDLAEPARLQNAAVLEAHPEVALLTSAFGGLRVLGANYLWIRSQAEHQAGRHYDAYQLAELICQLQPYFPGVWGFQAWNMAWNISVTKNTREQRWQWVYNGVKLLRDRGIPLNPDSQLLYKELSWIFFSKIGGQLDDMYMSYKQRWAGMMQRLLGAPPPALALTTTLAEETDAVIEVFRPIAEAPLDKDPRRQGPQPGQADATTYIQRDQQAKLLAEKAVQAYAKKLAPFGVRVDETLLDAYNRLSLDYAAQAVRVLPPNLRLEQGKKQIAQDPKLTADEADVRLQELQREEALLAVLNADDEADRTARDKMLAFVRAQILWNRYRLDPAFMLELMEKYQTPFDWRHAMPHAIYWAELGLKVAPSKDPSQMDELNNRRNVLNSLKNLTATGLVNLRLRPEQPDYPEYFETADLRYIEPTHRQHVTYIEEEIAITGRPFHDSFLAAGHENYLIEAIILLTADGRIVGPDGKAIPGTAQYYFDYLKKKYERKGGKWDHVSVEDFVVDNLQEQTGNLRYVTVIEILQYTLKRAYLARGLRGDQNTYRNRYGYARRIYQDYQDKAVNRMKLVDFRDIAATILANLLYAPRQFGVDLSVSDRSDIYLSMQDQSELLVRVYVRLGPYFQSLCREQELNAAAAFPPPPGWKEYRDRLRETFRNRPKDETIPR